MMLPFYNILKLGHALLVCM